MPCLWDQYEKWLGVQRAIQKDVFIWESNNALWAVCVCVYLGKPFPVMRRAGIP